MFLHLHLPGFQAFVHQVVDRRLRHKPVVVAVTLDDSAPVLSCSQEAWESGVRHGMRLCVARRYCSDLIARQPQADHARRTQDDIAGILQSYSPLLASSPGRWDLDLRGTEDLWAEGLAESTVVSSPVNQARIIADRVQQTLQDYFCRGAFIGIGRHPLSARVAAQLAAKQSPHDGTALITEGNEASAFWQVSVQDLPILHPVRDHLVFMGCHTVADALALGQTGLATLHHAVGRSLHACLTGETCQLPTSLDAEAHVSAALHAGPGGANPSEAIQLLHSIAQDLGQQLRCGNLAATRLNLTVKWGVGTTKQVVLVPDYQVRIDRDLRHLAECLLVKADWQQAPLTWMRLTATGLVAAEEQQDLFSLATSPWDQCGVVVVDRHQHPMPVAGHALITGG